MSNKKGKFDETHKSVRIFNEDVKDTEDTRYLDEEAKGYLEPIDSELNREVAKNDKKIKKGIVNTTMLNVREKPIDTSNPFGIIIEGDEVDIDTSFIDSKWFKIKAPTGHIGYVVQKYIKVI